jgi:hypothetical protein
MDPIREPEPVSFRSGQFVIFNAGKKILFIEGLENAFFSFQDFTFRAMPLIRDILPRCSGRYSMFRISFQWIIYVVTFETYASDVFFPFSHGLFNSR